MKSFDCWLYISLYTVHTDSNSLPMGFGTGCRRQGKVLPPPEAGEGTDVIAKSIAVGFLLLDRRFLQLVGEPKNCRYIMKPDVLSLGDALIRAHLELVKEERPKLHWNCHVREELQRCMKKPMGHHRLNELERFILRSLDIFGTIWNFAC